MIYEGSALRAKEVLENALKDMEREHKDEDYTKIQKIEISRLSAKLYVKQGCFEEANAVYMQSLKSVDQHLLPLWRDWMVMCFEAYAATDRIEWAQSAIAILPYALRYKPHKVRLIIAPILSILS